MLISQIDGGNKEKGKGKEITTPTYMHIFMTTSTYQNDYRQKMRTTLLPINMNIGTSENVYDKIKIYQIREEK